MAKRVHDLVPKCPARMTKATTGQKSDLPRGPNVVISHHASQGKKEGPGNVPALLYIKIKVSYLAGVVLAVSAVEA